jgi:hypothetical protein
MSNFLSQLTRRERARLLEELNYLTDLKHHRADGDWKALRHAKAKSALKTLARVAPAHAVERT